MTKYLAGVLSVIAVGVLLIAYGLLSPRASAYAPGELNQFARPVPASESMLLRDDPYAARYGYADRYQPAQYGAYTYPAPPAATEARPVRTAANSPAAARQVVRFEQPRRNWKKTALLIGGSTAGGAGLGGIFGGKKGALIGAAIGGGASTIYEATKN
jgi:hypothetical protein